MRFCSISVTALAVVLLATSAARGDDKATCIAASENAQKLKDAELMLAARDAFKSCAREACPAAVRKDCGENFEALDKKLLPTIVIRVRNAAGEDVVSATVKIDDEPSPMDGTASAVDPGRHKIHVHTADQNKVVDILAAQGERDRVVVVTLDGKTAVTPTQNAGATTSPAEQPASGGSVAQRVIGASMMGLGVVSLGFSVYELLSGMSESSMFAQEGSGLKTCTTDSAGNPAAASAVAPQPCHLTDASGLTHADRSNRQYVFMGVTGGLGLILVTIGSVLLATSFGSKPKATSTFTAKPFPLIGSHVGGLGVTGTF